MAQNLLDDSHFIDNLIIGKHVWSGKPELYRTPTLKKLLKTLKYLFVFIIVSFLMIFQTLNLLNVDFTAHIYFLITSFVYIVFVMRLIWQCYQFYQVYVSTYVITESHIGQISRKGKLMFQTPLSHIYQVVIEGTENREGTIKMMIKKSPSKKRKSKFPKKMPYPNFSFEGILNYKTTARLLVDKRNAAVYALGEF